MSNIARLSGPGLSAADFNQDKVAEGAPHRLLKLDRGWALVVDRDNPGDLEPGAELLDLRDARSEREAILRTLRWLHDNCRDGPDPEAGDALRAAANFVVDNPTNHIAVRRLANLLAPGISPFHEFHAELVPIFEPARAGAQLTDC